MARGATRRGQTPVQDDRLVVALSRAGSPSGGWRTFGRLDDRALLALPELRVERRTQDLSRGGQVGVIRVAAAAVVPQEPQPVGALILMRKALGRRAAAWIETVERFGYRFRSVE